MFGCRKTHTVVNGETLRTISRRYYGSPDYALYIYQHNETIVHDPNRITPGMELTIPHLPGMVFL